MLDAIERFLGDGHDAVDADRVLATIVTATIGAAGSSPAARQAFEAQARADIDRHRGRLLAFTPAQIQAAFDGPARAVRCAATLVAAGARADRAVRAGLHTGECELVAGEMRGVAVGLVGRPRGARPAGRGPRQPDAGRPRRRIRASSSTRAARQPFGDQRRPLRDLRGPSPGRLILTEPLPGPLRIARLPARSLCRL